MSVVVQVLNVTVPGLALAVLLLVVLGPYYAAAGLVIYAVARALPTRVKTSVKAVAVFTVALTFIAAARPMGNVHAVLAHFAGLDAMMTFGYCGGPCRVAKQILHDRYGIHEIPIAGCAVIGPEMWYTHGFNEIMMPLVVRERGTDVFESAYQEAVAQYREPKVPRSSDSP
jgi:hypothetical protein